MDELKQRLKDLTKQARDSSEGEFNCLMEFLNDQVASDHGIPDKELLIAICEQFCMTALFIKSRLMNLKEES